MTDTRDRQVEASTQDRSIKARTYDCTVGAETQNSLVDAKTQNPDRLDRAIILDCMVGAEIQDWSVEVSTQDCPVGKQSIVFFSCSTRGRDHREFSFLAIFHANLASKALFKSLKRRKISLPSLFGLHTFSQAVRAKKFPFERVNSHLNLLTIPSISLQMPLDILKVHNLIQPLKS